MFGFVKKSRPNDVRSAAGFVVNVFCWINFSNAAAFKGADKQCLTVNVSGSAHSVVNGQYQLDKSFGLHCNGHPVWTKTSSSSPLGHQGNATGFTYIYIYYQDDGFDGWIISNTSCYSWGNFIAGISSDSLTPYSDDADGSRMWQESINDARWTDSPRLTVVCDRFTPQIDESDQSTGSTSGIALFVVCILVAAGVFVTVFALTRRCCKDNRPKQEALIVAVVSDPSFRYQRVQSHDDVTGTGSQRDA